MEVALFSTRLDTTSKNASSRTQRRNIVHGNNHRQDFPHLVINRDSPAHAQNLVEKSRGLEGNTEEATTTDAEPSLAQ
ncbi:hypothetical protein Naga_100055g3 [Nannochloropsis gaditana]|uniref:Uncharacterized protein n=1 Tax=Nannochloropsis gaditana TaxID=72520 RepID=W7TMD1_9STRA|nr:hypothetical protein Naga_100055g3 [Nannochloropsis gaditana]